ncbi:MAG: glycosyl hydrolase family 28-related protein, partial [Deltaproteobacteria bacterium]
MSFKRYVFLTSILPLIFFIVSAFGADKRIQYNVKMVGANHPMLADTLNSLALVEHNNDGTHNKVTQVKDPYVDVRAFGALCDGVADDAAAIQAAVDYAVGLSPNTVVFFPPGNCLLSTGITIYSDMRFMGAASGNGISIISPTTSMADGDYLFKSDSLSRVYIDDLSFRVLSSHAKYQTVHGIKAWGLNRWQMRNVYMNGFNIALDIRKGATQEANNGLFNGLILQYSKTGAVVTGQDIRFIHPTIEQNKIGMLIGDIYASGDSHNKSITLEGAHFET